MDPETLKQIVRILIILSFFLMFFSLNIFMRLRNKEKLDPVAQMFGGKAFSSLTKGYYCLFEKNGLKGRIQITQRRPSGLILSLERSLGFDMKIHGINFVFKGLYIGSISSVKSGDPVFDAKYVVKAKNKILARNFLQDAEKRNAISWLFENGYHEFKSLNEEIYAKVYGCRGKNLDPVLIYMTYDYMMKLYDGN